MTDTNAKITASFTFRGAEFKDVDVINPGDWFGKTWLLEIGVGFSTFPHIVEADSASDAIDELIDSGKGEYLVIDEPDYADYGIGTDNPTCHFAGNNGRPVCLDNLLIHGDDRTGFECLYHVPGWPTPVKPTDLAAVREKMEQGYRVDPDDLDEFTIAYIEAALFTTTDNSNEQGGDPLDDNYGPEDLSPETLKEMVDDCRDFQTSFGELIADDLSRAGHDFWLTRNGHGAGFWDGDWDSPLPTSVETSKPYETVGDYLTDMSKPYGSVDLYVGDDGKIYS